MCFVGLSQKDSISPVLFAIGFDNVRSVGEVFGDPAQAPPLVLPVRVRFQAYILAYFQFGIIFGSHVERSFHLLLLEVDFFDDAIFQVLGEAVW